jgi:hypothetical protein
MFNFGDTGGLFDHFEVNRESFWRKMTWLIAGSGVWHLVIVVLILLIPPVRDAFSITAMFRDVGFVDRPYEHTDIEDATIIDFSNEKFHYPEGYWAMDQVGMPPLPEFPTPFTPAHFTPSTSPSPSPATSPTPTPTPDPLIAGNAGGNKPGKNPETKSTPTPSPDDKAAEQAQKELEAASKRTGIELPEEGAINKLPFKDLGKHASALNDANKLDFNQPFEITIESSLDKDGKLVKPTVTKKTGDETLLDLAKELVSAMNDSGVLYYLKEINKDKPGAKVTFTIKQDGKDVSATVDTETSSPDSANKLSRSFAVMLLLGARARGQHDEGILMKNTKVSADGNKLTFKLAMQHDDVVSIVKRGMEDAPSPTPTPIN